MCCVSKVSPMPSSASHLRCLWYPLRSPIPSMNCLLPCEDSSPLQSLAFCSIRCGLTTTGFLGDTVDRKSTRLNSSHANISYAVFCLKKKKKKTYITYECKKHVQTKYSVITVE